MAFSLKHLMFAMLVAATGLAALLNADRTFVAELVNLCTLTIIVITGYGVWTSEGARRAFRIGFVSWGSLYLLATKLLDIQLPLVTYTLLSLGWRTLEPARVTLLKGSVVYEEAQINWINRFYDVGYCLFTLLFGLIGGWVTVYFYRKRQRMQKMQA